MAYDMFYHQGNIIRFMILEKYKGVMSNKYSIFFICMTLN